MTGERGGGEDGMTARNGEVGPHPGATRSSGGVSRRAVLVGFASAVAAPALSQLDFLGGAGSAAARLPGAAGTELVRGGARRFNRPLLTPKHRIRLPRGIEVLPDTNSSHPARRRLKAGGPHRWPKVPTTDGGSTDLSVMPEPGEPGQTVYLTGFGSRGWYEITDGSGGAPVRVDWDASALPFLWLWAEWGATTDFPYHGRFYTLALEPVAGHLARV